MYLQEMKASVPGHLYRDMRLGQEDYLSHRCQLLWLDYSIPVSETLRYHLVYESVPDSVWPLRQRNKVHTLKGAPSKPTKEVTFYRTNISGFPVPRKQTGFNGDVTTAKFEIFWDAWVNLWGDEVDARVDAKKCGKGVYECDF